MEKLAVADDYITRMEQKLSEAKARRHMLATVDIPEAMAEFGSFTFSNDQYTCKVEEKIYGSLPKDEEQREAAIEYLREIDQEGIIKATLKMEFARGDLSAARRIRRVIARSSNEAVDVAMDVNHMTLAAMARARIAANKPVRLDLLGLRTLTIANVKTRIQKED